MHKQHQEHVDRSTPTTPLRWPPILCAGLLAVMAVAAHAANAANTTGLPDYPGATPGVMDGVYRKLVGSKFEHGHDFANVYRNAGDKNTSIELFKCKS